MKKICVIHHTSLLGGGTKSFFDILNMLKDKSDIVACIPKGSNEIIQLLKKSNINYYEITSNIPVFPYYSGSSSLISKSSIKSYIKLKEAQNFVNEILALEPDLLIFNSIVSCISAKKFPAHIRKICFVRETFNRKLWDNIYRKVLDENFDGVCFIADSERQYIKLKRPITAVIPDCLAPSDIVFYSKEDACKLEKLNPNNFNILFMGGMDYIKGADVILKAMTLLDGNYFLILGGYFNEELLKLNSIVKLWSSPRLLRNRLRIRKYYYRLLKENRIKCVGYRNDISTLMCACDTVVFPSNKAHQPRPGIEAGEYKKSIILSDFDATKEYFIHEYNSLTFKIYSSKDLAKKINILKNDPKLNQKIGENNYNMTITKHNYLETKEKLKIFLDNFI